MVFNEKQEKLNIIEDRKHFPKYKDLLKIKPKEAMFRTEKSWTLRPYNRIDEKLN